MSNSEIRPNPTSFEMNGTMNDEQKIAYKPDDIALENGSHTVDPDSLSDIKEAEVIDPYGNEDGAEIQCRSHNFQLLKNYS